MNMSTEAASWISVRARRLPAGHVKRDELVSALLQDRGSLRVITAPHGFGKTVLVQEYACRLFAEDAVAWVDASCPDFLLALDNGQVRSALMDREGVRLFVIDDLPWLHEERSQELSKAIDALLYAGKELIVTARPLCDSISALQSEKLAMFASELLIKERECAPRQHVDQDGDGRAFAMRRWRDAGDAMFGRTPLSMWGSSPNAQRQCMCELFSERLPFDLLRMMFAMMLLGEGAFADLESMAMTVRHEDIMLLARDYPVFGIDPVAGRYRVGQFDMTDLKHAICVNRLESTVLEGENALPERVLGALFKQRAYKRGSEVIGTFCDDGRCATLLEMHGWDFIDAGEIDLTSNLLERCAEQAYALDPGLQAMHAWVAALSGDRREACHIARHVLSATSEALPPQEARLAAFIALAQFDDSAASPSKPESWALEGNPGSPVDFLGALLDDCASNEIARAFSLSHAECDVRLEKERRAPGKVRARRLASLFSEHADRFGDSRAFRVALHVLAHIDSVELRRMVQELGCDEILRMRRAGVMSFSEALLVLDMWNTGYFGLVGPVIDRRDAKILDGASHMLEKLSHCTESEPIAIPWEAMGAQADKGMQKPRVSIPQAGVEEMYVRMFGGFEITIGDRYLSEGKWRKKARALFGLLVLNNGRDVPRDDLFAQLWPGGTRTHALDNFYTVWGNCTSIVGESPYLDRNGEYCRIDPRFVRSDVADFEQLTRHLLVADQDSSRALDTYAKIEVLYRGSLMPSEKNVRAINAQRERYRALYIDAMLAATQCALNASDTRVALWFARKAMEEDQSREDVYRTLMKAQIAAGQRCTAIKTFLVCREYMQGAYGLDPSLETRELYDSLIMTDPELLRLETAFATRSPAHAKGLAS